MGGALSTWEMIALGGAALLVLFWMGPGIKGMLQKSKEAEKDWPAALIPLAIVVLFVFLLVSMV